MQRAPVDFLVLSPNSNASCRPDRECLCGCSFKGPLTWEGFSRRGTSMLIPEGMQDGAFELGPMCGGRQIEGGGVASTFLSVSRGYHLIGG